MTDVTFGLRFTADQRELQAAADKGVEATRKVGEESKKSNEQAARAAEQHTAALKRQADTLGMSRTQVMAYEAAQHKMTEAQRQSVQASISAIDAYDRKQVMLGRISAMAATAGAALGVGLVAGLKASVAAAGEAEQSQLRLDAVLKATRNSAGLNSDELNAMSRDMQNRLGINDEAVKDSMAVLLTFREVTRESFGEAMEVAANLSAVMQTDLKSATLQLGKALENPEQGLTALTRSGISFNAAQKAMIQDLAETGHKAEAITMILQVMRQQGLNGVVDAMNTGVVGASRNFRNGWDDLLEAIGKSDPIMKPVIGTIDAITKAVRTLEQAVDGGLGDAFLSFATFGLYTPDPKRAAPIAQANAWEGDDRDAGIAARRVEANREKANEYLKQFRTDNEKLGEEIRKFRALAAAAGMSADEAAAGEARIRAKVAKKGSDDGKAGISLITQLQTELDNATGAGNEYDAFVRKLTDGTMKLTEAQIAEALALKGQTVEIKRAKEAREAYLKQAEYDAELQEEINQLRLKASQAAAQANKDSFEAIRNVELETQLLGLNSTEREKAIALRALEARAVHLTTEELQRYREEIIAAYDAKGRKEASVKAIEDDLDAQRRFNDELARGLTDSIFRGFEGGKSFARNFWDSLKNTAKTTVLQPVVKFLVSPLTSAVGGALGALGIPGMANASTGGGGGLGGLLGGSGGLGNMMGWITNSGGIAGQGGGFMGGLNAFAALPNTIFQNAGVNMGSQFIADIGNFGYGAPVMAGVMNLLAGNTRGAIASAGLGAIGTMVGGPIGGMIGSALGSLAGGGKKTPATFTGYNLAGSVSREGISGALYGTATGGSGNTSWAHADLATAYGGAFAQQNQRVVALYSQIEAIARGLGYSVNTAATASFNLAGVSDAQVASGEAVTLAMDQVAEQLGRQIIPNFEALARAGETAAQTLARVATEAQQSRINRMGAALGLADTTRDLWLSDLSPLSPEARLREAGLRFNETLTAARSGDAGAIANLGGLSRGYLEQARGFYASGSGYNDIFNQVQTDVGTLVKDTLVENAMAFAGMSGSLAEIAINTANLDKRIGAQIEAAFKAKDIADEALRRAELATNAALLAEVRDLRAQLERVNA